MMEINSTTFRSIIINGRKYEYDVIIMQGKIQETRTQVRALNFKKRIRYFS
jgi:hypothetical protein